MDKRLFVAGLLAAFGIGAPAEAAAVLWSGNGHRYDYVSTAATFADALSAAAASTGPNGEKGYLVTVTSQEEWTFVRDLVPSGALAWAGGSDADEEGTWRWIAGPEAGEIFYKGHAWEANTCSLYCNWSSGEPNEVGDEDALVLNWNGNGQWNDQNGGVAHGYIVEYGGLASTVPEPGAWAMMIAGFGLIGAAARRRRRSIVAPAIG